MTVSPWTVRHIYSRCATVSTEQSALKALGKNIRSRRKACGLTQEQVAHLCEYDPTYISLLERGQRNPPFLTLVKIAGHLQCSVSELTVL